MNVPAATASDTPAIAGHAVLIAQFFPPFNSVASQRALRMARVLLKRYEKLYVVTLPTNRLPAELVDSTLAREELADERLQLVTVAPLLGGYGIVAKPKLYQRALGALLTRALCSSGSDWMSPLAATLNRIAVDPQIRIVLSTGGPFAPFLQAIRFGRAKRIPCILDYRDLWTQNPRAPYPRLFRILVRYTLERYVTRRCSMITTVSHGCERSLQNLGSGPPVQTLMNTPDQTYASWFRLQMAGHTSGFDERYLNVVLAGTVYRECTCRLFLEALKLLEPRARGQVRLHYLGLSAELIRDEFASAGMSEFVIDHGFVKKDAAAAAVNGADALLSLVFDGAQARPSSAVLGLMTTKVFDYFLSGRPIINVGPPQADVCVLAKEMGYGEFHSFQAGEAHALARFLAAATADLPRFRERGARAALPDFAALFEQIVARVDPAQPALTRSGIHSLPNPSPSRGASSHG